MEQKLNPAISLFFPMIVSWISGTLTGRRMLDVTLAIHKPIIATFKGRRWLIVLIYLLLNSS